MKIPGLPCRLPANRSRRGFTLIEMLFTIVIIVVLSSMAFVAFNKAVDAAHKSKSISNLNALVSTAHSWATDHGGKIPSPEYPGDYKTATYPTKGSSPSESNPKYWDLDASGQWLDGVLFARLYIENEEDQDDAAAASVTLEQFANSSSRATDGKHLPDTVFESPASVDTFRTETDWYRHSYAMNANLQFDGMFAEVDAKSGAWLTEKSLGNLPFQTNAALFIDCIEKNVVMAEDVEMVREASERAGGRGVLVGFVDGHVESVKPLNIPDGDVFTDPEASRFWRGVREN